MKSIIFLCLASVTLSLFSSCGECACNSINKDYLQDVPVTRSQRF